MADVVSPKTVWAYDDGRFISADECDSSGRKVNLVGRRLFHAAWY